MGRVSSRLLFFGWEVNYFPDFDDRVSNGTRTNVLHIDVNDKPFLVDIFVRLANFVLYSLFG